MSIVKIDSSEAFVLEISKKSISPLALFITGDIEQIDNAYVNETSNGLAHAIESFKEYHISGHVSFKKGERSDLATLASKVL